MDNHLFWKMIKSHKYQGFDMDIYFLQKPELLPEIVAWGEGGRTPATAVADNSNLSVI